eukprot:CAMPEP_0197072430 /NCGR_PEP_ID=MMETSP1384-20130603/210089_1 /TAXON_ID=29189 /ORGANISM="Ammonia sp." /LENGTH=994 /DNA_ID=CAMNT_0042511247 /DNA_START=95 /DNA_END=3079 /DNA_ORIENTATION=-
MDWSDSVFREHVKYYGDVEFTADNIVGDNGIVCSKKFMAFRYNKKVGILSTDFETNIDEKLAQGRKAEYGSKVYTTTQVDQIEDIDSEINVLQFDPFNDDRLFVGGSNGTLSIYDIGSNNNKVLCVNELSSCVYSVASHPSSSEVLAVGGNGNLNLIDLTKEGQSVRNTPLENESIVRMTFAENASYLRGVTQDKLLFTHDPRTADAMDNCVKLRYAPTNIVNLYGETQIAVAGMTSFLEPIVFGYDLAAKLDDNIHETYLFKQNYSHKQCTPFIRYDRFSQILYVTFQSVADLTCFNTVDNSFEKQAMYHSVNDTFMGMDILPKHATKKREINRVLKFAKNRVQQIVHTRGGKLIWDSLHKEAKKSMCSCDEYVNESKNVAYPDDEVAKLVPVDYEEAKKRSVSLYLHIAGKEPLSQTEKYFDLKVSSTVNCNLGLNVKTNSKYALFPAPTYGGGALGIIQVSKPGRKKQATPNTALFPAPTYGGGALGIIQVSKPGRKKQAQLTAHSDKITTFDVGQTAENGQLVITGSPDTKAIIQKINEDDNHNITGCETLNTVQCAGKVTFVGFHPRIKNLCVIASNKDGAKDVAFVYFYDYGKGEVVREVKLENTNNIMDVQFETVIGLIAALSSSKGNVKLMDIRTGNILTEFKADTFARDTKLFWKTNQAGHKPKYYTQLICLGFGTSSVRKFSVYDLENVVAKYYKDNCAISVGEAKEEEQGKADADDDDNGDDEKKPDGDELQNIGTLSFGVSNAIPIGYYDGSDNLLYVSSIGNRKIRVYELLRNNPREMNASYQSKEDIQGISFALKQEAKVKKVELAKCFKLSKDGVVSPISFSIPRKRTDFFQDDLYSPVLDVVNSTYEVDLKTEDMNKVKIDGTQDDLYSPVLDVVNSTYEVDLKTEDMNKVKIDVNYVDLKPDDMELLSNAPEEEETVYQKRRKSQINIMEAEKLKEQPKSTEQAFDQFARMVADAPTANRWDAENIGTEVADDEWDD